ncbi:MAG: DUF5666 domain-containing protein [Minisyncoccia bacterium]
MHTLSKSARQALAVGLTLIGLFAITSSAFAAEPAGRAGFGGFRGGPNMPRPAVVGTVASISGNTLTVTSRAWAGGRGHATTTPATSSVSTTYTVDATNATVTKNGAASTVSAIATGDTVMVEGTVSGTSVTATAIRDGMMGRGGPGGFGGKQGQGPRFGSNTPATNTPVITGNGQPVIGGNVTAISGNTLTVTNKSSVTYSVDATSAKIVKHGVATSTISNVSVGDSVVVQGTVNGTSITASTVIDNGTPPAAPAGTASGTPPAKHGGFLGAIGGFFSHLFGFF